MSKHSRSPARLTFDAVAVLGFGQPNAEPLPEPGPGEFVIRVGAWSLEDLWTNETVVRQELLDWDMADGEPWSYTKLFPGIYRLRFPVPRSNRKTFAQQKALLLPDEAVAPVPLVVAAAAVYLKEEGLGLLRGRGYRCDAVFTPSAHITITSHERQIAVACAADDEQHADLWLAAARKVS